MMYVVQFALKQ